MTLSVSSSSSSSSLPGLADRRRPNEFDPQELASRLMPPRYQQPDSNKADDRNTTIRDDGSNIRRHTMVLGGLRHGQDRNEDETSDDAPTTHHHHDHKAVDDRSPSKQPTKLFAQDQPLYRPTPSTRNVRLPPYQAYLNECYLKPSPQRAAPQELHDDHPSRPGQKVELDASEKRFHEEFNKQMFNIDLDGNGLDGKPPITPRSSQQLTNEGYEDLLEICFSHQSGDSERWRESFQKYNTKIYDVIKNYRAKVVTDASGVQVKKLYFQGLQAVPQRDVFMAIRACHTATRKHTKQHATYETVKCLYSNITQKMVNKYIAMCPTCNSRKSIIKQKRLTTRPAFPIDTPTFRDRFLVYLIDMKDKAEEDVRGVLCKWLLVIQDHCTKLTYCEPIPRKRPIFVAEVLSRIFGLIGAPKLMQADNGKESTAKDIIEALRELDENIPTVFGRLQKPDDLGAVENTKKMIKSILQDLENDQRANGKTPNWTLLMGQLSSRLNSK